LGSPIPASTITVGESTAWAGGAAITSTNGNPATIRLLLGHQRASNA
jgi:hypothetical protein